MNYPKPNIRVDSHTGATLPDGVGKHAVHQPWVLIVTPHFSTRGGIQNYCKTIYAKLQGVELFFIGRCRKNEPHWLLFPRLVYHYLRFFFRLMRGGVDVVHINTSLVSNSLVREGALLLITRLLHVETLVFFHGWSKNVEARVVTSYRRLFKWVYGNAGVVVVLAEDFKSVLRGIGFRMPVYVETTFVDDRVFGALDEGTIGKARAAEHPPTLLFLSRVLRAKGIFETLGAFTLAKMKYPALRLIVAGEGDDLDAVKKFVASENLKDVLFVGFVDDEEKMSVFLQADIFVLPTQYGEGLPISMVEAMLCGLPVLTCPVGGIQDFFEHGEMGFLVETPDERELAKFITLLLSDSERRRSMGLKNHRYARARFMSTMAAHRMDTYYHQLTQEQQS